MARRALQIGVLLVAACCVALVRGQAFQPSTVVEAIDAALFLTQFKDGLQAAGLLRRLSEPGFNGTVLAPTDQGFTAYLQAANTTLPLLEASNSSLLPLMEIHIIPDLKLYPPATLRQDLKLPTLQGTQLTVDRTTPGLIHIWASPKELGVTNFATLLQFQEIQGGGAVLYVIDKPLVPSSQQPPRVSAAGRP